jgi:hypothetical protein
MPKANNSQGKSKKAKGKSEEGGASVSRSQFCPLPFYFCLGFALTGARGFG